MMLADYPVYRKDLRVLAKQLAGTFGVQLFFLLMVPVIVVMNDLLTGNPKVTGMQNWFPKLQIVTSAILALSAAAYWSAEERAASTSLFLHRLAASRGRIWGEKLAAGWTVVTLAVTGQGIWLWLMAKAGRIEIVPGDRTFGLIVAATVSSYLIGLPFSLLLGQTIAVILVGLAFEFIFIWCYSIWTHDIVLKDWQILTVLVLLGIPCFVSLAADALGLRLGFSTARRTKSRILPLFFKSIRENSLLLLFAITLVGLGLLSAYLPPVSHFFLLCAIVVVSATLGTTTYGERDKDGTGSFLYAHPVSRNTMYWTQFAAGLIPAILLAAASTSILLLLIESKNLPTALQGVYSFDELSMTWGHCFRIFLSGMIPFCCGALVTHAVPRPFYAALLTLPVALTCWAVAKYLLNAGVLAVLIAQTNLLEGYRGLLRIYDGIPWPLLWILAGLALAGWRAATDRAVATGTVFYRQGYVLRLVLFVLAITVLANRTGWLDLFFLVTGLDLGMS